MTSGTIATVGFKTHELIDAAYRRCRVPAQKISGEKLANARGQLKLMLDALPSNVTALWARDHRLVALPVGAKAIAMPPGTTQVISASLRTLTRLSGTPTASTGVASRGFDGDASTSVALAAGGTLAVALGSVAPISTIGIMLASAVSTSLAIETSLDGTTWSVVAPYPAQSFPAKAMVWLDLDPVIQTAYLRLRETGAQAIDVAEFFVGTNPQDRVLGQINRDEYLSLPNKGSFGSPLQYWADRTVDGPVLRLWPTTSQANQFQVLSVWRQRVLMDVGALSGSIEVPAHWYEAILAGLAVRIALDDPDVDAGLINVLKPLADEAMVKASMAGSDGAGLTLEFDLSGYR